MSGPAFGFALHPDRLRTGFDRPDGLARVILHANLSGLARAIAGLSGRHRAGRRAVVVATRAR